MREFFVVFLLALVSCSPVDAPPPESLVSDCIISADEVELFGRGMSMPHMARVIGQMGEPMNLDERNHATIWAWKNPNGSTLTAEFKDTGGLKTWTVKGDLCEGDAPSQDFGCRVSFAKYMELKQIEDDYDLNDMKRIFGWDYALMYQKEEKAQEWHSRYRYYNNKHEYVEFHLINGKAGKGNTGATWPNSLCGTSL